MLPLLQTCCLHLRGGAPQHPRSSSSRISALFTVYMVKPSETDLFEPDFCYYTWKGIVPVSGGHPIQPTTEKKEQLPIHHKRGGRASLPVLINICQQMLFFVLLTTIIKQGYSSKESLLVLLPQASFSGSLP